MPQSLSFVTLDVFTQDRYLGNPLAVVNVPAGRDVSTEVMQTIAREFNLSETIFVHEGAKGKDGVVEWRVRIFLTRREVPFAGHPTIGAAVYALSTLAPSSRGRFLANAGPIDLTFNDNFAKASIPHSLHIHTRYPFTLEQVYALQPSLRGVLRDQSAITVASPVKGMSFVMVELPDLSALEKITTSPKPSPKLDDYDDWDTGFSGSYFYVFTSTPKADDGTPLFKLQTRMIEGVLEDPATGSAACALTSVLALKNAKSSSRKVFHFEVTQGLEMGRKSDIGVTVTLDPKLEAVEKVELAGSAVKVMEGVVEY
ncbi:hypothetical protein M409DRAFT_48721 [Zasmidium cellare ATCC 36951]|uniref:Phenazine biosynthesis protein n=1 Tax=Zasmidium cellare ATCC 36951 TaxID=1080233 RepID=A0A6A6D314_ZASCE|nr:uncharacterized protein M409DRAFT_48721 [Zasmidium cellare ATCC 36951]KAF2173797.1 hypothetical protein M409DRAFT_48721 [Zasmidium cellare ATCC 36951]